MECKPTHQLTSDVLASQTKYLAWNTRAFVIDTHLKDKTNKNTTYDKSKLTNVPVAPMLNSDLWIMFVSA